MKLVNSREMKQIDARAINEYNIPGIVLMENAGIRTVEVIEEILHGSAGKTVLILVGKGNNGGDGLVIARHLMNAGAQVLVFALSGPEVLPPDARTNYEILRKMGGQICELRQEADLDSFMLAF